MKSIAVVLKCDTLWSKKHHLKTHINNIKETNLSDLGVELPGGRICVAWGLGVTRRLSILTYGMDGYRKSVLDRRLLSSPRVTESSGASASSNHLQDGAGCFKASYQGRSKFPRRIEWVTDGSGDRDCPS